MSAGIYDKNKTYEADVLVVGGGLAGVWAAYAAKHFSKDCRVILVDKGKVARSGQSPMIAGVFTIRFPEDDFDLWRQELIERGEYLNDQEWVNIYLNEVHPWAMEMDKWNPKIFERDQKGGFVRRLTRAHLNTKTNVINSLPMMDTMRAICLKNGVKLVERVAVTDLVKAEGRIAGAVGFDYRTGEAVIFKARAVVLATAGCGFKSVFIGHRNLCGETQAAAFKIGAAFRNLEFFGGNTCAKNFDTHGMNLFVGVGGKFVNQRGEEFMWKYNPLLGSRARQNELALAFCREVKEGRGPIYLDLRAAGPGDRKLCRKILPETFKMFDRAGIDPFEQDPGVEWIPSVYGTLGGTGTGGPHIDLNGQTTVTGLYAAGDITPVPVHGTYSVGGINVGFCLINGLRAGKHAAHQAEELPPVDYTKSEIKQQWGDKIEEFLAPLLRAKGVPARQVTKSIQEVIIPYPVSYLKSEDSLNRALARIQKVREVAENEVYAVDPHGLIEANEVKAMSFIAELMIRASLFRKESRGSHFMEEYPRTDNVNWLKWVMVKQGAGSKIEITTENVTTPYIKPKEEYSIPPGLRRE